MIIWYVWSWTKVSMLGLRLALMHRPFMSTLLTLCRSLARTFRRFFCPFLLLISWAEVYPNRVSAFFSAWNYLASTHANAHATKHSGPASLPRKSQAASNGGIPHWAGGGYLFSSSTWVLAFYLCIHKQRKYICMYTQPSYLKQCIHTYVYIYAYIVELIFLP